MKFSARDLVWLVVVVVLSAGWAADHLRLEFKLAMNDWAWQMHPQGGQRVMINGEVSSVPVSPARPPPAFFTVEGTEDQNQRPFSFLGRPISGDDLESADADRGPDQSR